MSLYDKKSILYLNAMFFKVNGYECPPIKVKLWTAR